MAKALAIIILLWIGVMIIGGMGSEEEYSIKKVDQIVFYVDKEFNGDERIEIERGINEWNRVLNGRVKIKVGGWEEDVEIYKLIKKSHTGKKYIVKIESRSHLLYEGGDTVVLGFVDKRGGDLIYLVMDRLKREDIYYIIMHEMGHILGAEHGLGLMSHEYSKEDYGCVDMKTAEKVSRSLGIKVWEMRGCF